MPNIHYAWFIGLAGGSILLFLCYYFLSSFNYKKRFENQYDVRNCFPYEFNFESKFTDNILGNVALILSMVFSMGLFALGLAYFKTNGYLVASIIAGIVYSILVLGINFTPLKLLRVHFVVMVLLFAASFFTPMAVGLTSFNIYQGTKNPFVLALMIACFVVGLVMFVFIMNPRLSFNIKMQVAVDEEGNEKYIRPKFIPVAFTEWLMVLLVPINQILFTLLVIALAVNG
ncbi:MAG: hypothetical protein J5511_01940 [Bacilli bacterium]|nr:hypothetical protein [Bacilli bacterium]